LLIEGAADNLFTLQEAVTNYAILRREGVPVKMLWFCGGHGICLTNPGDTALIDRDTIGWLDRYLDRRRSVSTGSTFEWVDENGSSTRVYAQVVDDATGKVLGNQITPIPVTLDGATHTLTQPLEILSATQARGQNFTLQLTASTVAYETQRATGTVTFSKIQI